MSTDHVVREIAEGLLSAGATADSVNERSSLAIKEIAPYPSLFRAEIRRRFDATRIGQALIGNADIQTIINGEITWVQGHWPGDVHLVDIDTRSRFNPNLYKPWFSG